MNRECPEGFIYRFIKQWSITTQGNKEQEEDPLDFCHEAFVIQLLTFSTTNKTEFLVTVKFKRTWRIVRSDFLSS